MALIDMTIDATTNVVAFRANNAPEMRLALQTFLSGAAPTLYVWDAQLVGGGLAPNFLCTLTVGQSEGGGTAVHVAANDLTAIVIGGMDGNSIDVVAMATALGASIVDTGTGLTKTQIACGGGGPHWMGLALVI